MSAEQTPDTPSYLYYKSILGYLKGERKSPAPADAEANDGESGANTTPWKLSGTYPVSNSILASQLITSQNYFTCYCCGNSVRSWAWQDWPVGDLQARAENFSAIFSDAIPTSPSTPIRFKRNAQRANRENFYAKYAFPPCGKSLGNEKGKKLDMEALLSRIANGRSTRQAIKAQALRMLDEVQLYKAMLAGDKDGLPETLREYCDLPQEARTLQFYRRMLPLWVFTQRRALDLYDDLDCSAVPRNIYNLDFWTHSPGPKSAEAPVPQLIDELCACYSQDSLADDDRIEEYRAKCTALWEACVNEDPKTSEDAWRQAHRDQAEKEPTIRELLSSPELVPAWACRLAALIEAIAVASYIGIEAALDGICAYNSAALTTIKAQAGTNLPSSKDRFMATNALGADSGTVALTLIDDVTSNISRLKSIKLDKAQDDAYALICLIGNGRYNPARPDGYISEFMAFTSDFFTVNYQLDPEQPGSLLHCLYDAAAQYDPTTTGGTLRLGNYAFVGEVKKNPAGTVQVFQSILRKRAAECLAMPAASTDGRVSVLMRGSDRNKADGTLRKIAEDAASDFDAYLKELKKASDKPASSGNATRDGIKTDTANHIKDCIESWYYSLCSSASASGQSGSSESAIMGKLRDLESDYIAKYPQDPAAIALFSALRNALSGFFKEHCSNELHVNELVQRVEETYESYKRSESSKFIAIESADGDVSRRHAVLFLKDGCLFAADAGSSNGTVVLHDGPDGEKCLLLEGAHDTDRMKAAAWAAQAQTTSARQLFRGDVIRLAGSAAIRVG